MTAVTDRADEPVRRSVWPAFAAPALVLTTLIAQFLTSHSYDLLQPEALIVLSAAAVAGLAIGAIGRLRPGTLEPLLLGILLVVFIAKRPELSNPLRAVLRMTVGNLGDLVGLGLFLGFPVAVLLMCWALRQHLSAIVSTVFGTMLLATITLTDGAAGQSVRTGALPSDGSDLPPIIHIILDEHIGLAGIPPDVEGSSEATDILKSTYRDFALYSHAFSRFAHTQLALASLMNAKQGTDMADVLANPQDSHKFRLLGNEWFRQLGRRNYRISVYESSYLDFCGAADSCYVYGGFLYSLQESAATTTQRIRIILAKLFNPGLPSSGGLGAISGLYRFLEDIKRRPQGTAYVLHLMLPHFGYLLRSDCSVAEPTQWDFVGPREERVLNTSAERRARYRLYLSQLVCATKKIEEVINTLKKIGVYDAATIIVHGDHGSRLAQRSWYNVDADELSDRDMIDQFSTLLAVKAPNTLAGIDTEPVAVQDFFARHFLAINPPDDPGNTVFFRETGDSFVARKIRWPAFDSLATKLHHEAEPRRTYETLDARDASQHSPRLSD